jgi:alkanesulfonate monooxygenase SsuD/methylene tetrahydromethanopterin reductase-like flavin-dependent oxidoreductase (luciferase family)
MTGTGITVGVQTLQHGTSVAELSRAWRQIDDLGLDSAWLMDHLFPMPYPSGNGTDAGCFEGWTLLAALGAGTRRAAVGCLVTAATLRNPALLARMAVTVDHVTGGRLLMGIGAGWYGPDHAGTGTRFPPAGERFDRLAEALDVLRYCWAGRDDGFTGRFHTMPAGLPALPRPVAGTVPLLVGGNGERTMRLAARYADEWNMYAPTYDTFPLLRARFDRYVAQAGRPPGSVRRTLHMPFSVAGTAREVQALWRREFRGAAQVEKLVDTGAVVSGTVDEVVGQLRRYVAAGADGFVLGLEPPFDPTTLTLLAREVVPAILEV